LSDIASESPSELKFEIGHVLFIDIVGYSKLRIDEQKECMGRLTEIVLATPQVRKATNEQLVRLPTGDGMALVFRNSPEEPVRCALEIAQALKSLPGTAVRMGVHSGPVSEVVDLNQRANMAGAGINMAQRVMDCGDAGHILLSKHVTDDLGNYGRWQPYLHDLGECEVKHGIRIGLVNFYGDGLGNPQLPNTCHTQKKRRVRMRLAVAAAALLALVALIFGIAVVYRPHRRSTLTAPEKSIAVLPFENLSDDKANAYFAEGVQDEILTDLAKVAELKVISRTSVMQYKDAATRNVREIGQQLGVAHVLEGSVQRAKERVRINAQLIDARNDAHLWAQTYDRDLADVFSIQSEIAQTIAQQLQAHLSPVERHEIAKAPTTDVVAYDLYVRARALDDLANEPGGKDNLLQGVSLLQEAVRRDPKFMLAYCLLCETHLDLYWGGFDHTSARRDEAKAALEQAERIDADAAEVHVEKGVYAYHGFRDYEKARAEFELARRTLPNSSRLCMHIGAIDRRQGRWDDVLRNFNRAVELDPRNSLVLEETGFTYNGLRRTAEARPLLERAAAVNPQDIFVRAVLWQIPYIDHANTTPLRERLNELLQQGKNAAAAISGAFVECALAERDRNAAEQALSLIPPEGTVDPGNDSLWPRDWFVGLVARTFGDKDGAQRAFTAARTIAAKTAQEQPDYAAAWSVLGATDAGLGHNDDAIAEGKRACELLPLSKDAWDGPSYILNLALIYAWVGEKDLALEQLAISAKIPGGVTYGELKLFPSWDPLRGDPRFEKIVADLAPRDTKR
jgi:TolB-like protein/Tfp pilus assembly protein PilF